MGEVDHIEGAAAAQAALVLGRAHRALISVLGRGDIEAACAAVERAADRLDAIARQGTGTVALNRSLGGWRDHLSSHVHAARALAEVGVHHETAEDLLERGLAEVSAELASRRGASIPSFR